MSSSVLQRFLASNEIKISDPFSDFTALSFLEKADLLYLENLQTLEALGKILNGEKSVVFQDPLDLKIVKECKIDDELFLCKDLDDDEEMKIFIFEFVHFLTLKDGLELDRNFMDVQFFDISNKIVVFKHSTGLTFSDLLAEGQAPSRESLTELFQVFIKMFVNSLRHEEITSDNIFVTPDSVKFVRFGSFVKSNVQSGLPETHYRNFSVLTKSDLFSLGVLLELLTDQNGQWKRHWSDYEESVVDWCLSMRAKFSLAKIFNCYSLNKIYEEDSQREVLEKAIEIVQNQYNPKAHEEYQKALTFLRSDSAGQVRFTDRKYFKQVLGKEDNTYMCKMRSSSKRAGGGTKEGFVCTEFYSIEAFRQAVVDHVNLVNYLTLEPTTEEMASLKFVDIKNGILIYDLASMDHLRFFTAVSYLFFKHPRILDDESVDFEEVRSLDNQGGMSFTSICRKTSPASKVTTSDESSSEDLPLSRQISASKVLCKKPNSKSMFRREVRGAVAVLRLLDRFPKYGRYFSELSHVNLKEGKLVFELIEGLDMSEFQRDSYFKSSTFLGLFNAVHLLFVNRVRHNDIKAENVLIESANGVIPKLIDYGLLAPTNVKINSGSHHYISPNRPVTDIFALAILLTKYFGKTFYREGNFDELHFNKIVLVYQMDKFIWAKKGAHELCLDFAFKRYFEIKSTFQLIKELFCVGYFGTEDQGQAVLEAAIFYIKNKSQFAYDLGSIDYEGFVLK